MGWTGLGCRTVMPQYLSTDPNAGQRYLSTDPNVVADSVVPSAGVPPYAATARMIPQSTFEGDPLGTRRGSQADRRVAPASRPEWFMEMPPQTTTADKPWPEGIPAQLVEATRRSFVDPAVKAGKG